MFKFEDLLQEVGEFGRYQTLKYTLFLIGNIFVGWHTLSIIFVGGKQDYWCAVPEVGNLTSESLANGSSSIDNSTARIGCSAWTFDQSQYISTIRSQYVLTCDRAWLVAMTQTVYMFGWLLGTTSLGWISDKFGRRVAYFITYTMVVVVGSIQAFMPNIYLYFVTKLFLGAAGGSFFAIALVLIMEVSGDKHRVWLSAVYHFGFVTSMFYLPLIGWFVRDVYYLQIILGFVPALFLPTFYFVDESPRWLLQKHRFDEAEILFKKIAKINRAKIADDGELLREIKQATRDVERAQDIATKTLGKQPGLIDIMRIPNLRKISIICFLQWFQVAGSYYGLLLMPSASGTNAYVSTASAGAAAPVAFAIVIPVMMKLGRRWCMGGLGVSLGILLGLSAIVMNFKSLSWLLTTLIFLCRVATQGGFCTVYLFTAELFPTVVRNLGVGTGSSFARIGGLLAPQLSLLIPIWRPLPILVLGGLCVTTGVLNYFLPETLNQKLPDTLEDGANFGIRRIKPKDKPAADTEMEGLTSSER